MNVQESSALEELMSCISQVVSHSGNSTNKVGPWSQMGLFSEELDSVSFLAS
jgi:hypothetical protein